RMKPGAENAWGCDAARRRLPRAFVLVCQHLDPAGHVPDAQDATDRILAVLREELARPDDPRGCQTLAVGTELQPADPVLRPEGLQRWYGPAQPLAASR